MISVSAKTGFVCVLLSLPLCGQDPASKPAPPPVELTAPPSPQAVPPAQDTATQAPAESAAPAATAQANPQTYVWKADEPGCAKKVVNGFTQHSCSVGDYAYAISRNQVRELTKLDVAFTHVLDHAISFGPENFQWSNDGGHTLHPVLTGDHAAVILSHKPGSPVVYPHDLSGTIKVLAESKISESQEVVYNGKKYSPSEFAHLTQLKQAMLPAGKQVTGSIYLPYMKNAGVINLYIKVNGDTLVIPID